jgi:PIN domain nuclease of toxin-antitoxin system
MDAYLDQGNDCYLSVASSWEIAIKCSRGKMTLPRNPRTYVPQLRQRGNVASLVVSEEAALYVGQLPWLHTDPFDRMLVAQAVVEGMTLVTCDEEIQRYAVKTLW